MQKQKTHRSYLVAAAIALVVGLGCSSGGDSEATEPAAAPPTTTADKTTAAKEKQGSQIPPTPDPATWAAYVEALEAIDSDIVHGKEEKAVDRGRNQCTSVRDRPDDEAKLIELTNKRFTSPSHPDGFGEAKAKRILAAVRKHICPTY